jgi:Protein of unknown function (DUF2510)
MKTGSAEQGFGPFGEKITMPAATPRQTIEPHDEVRITPERGSKDPDRIAGWRVDPAGTYPFRFHNGRRWTEVVLTWEGRIQRGTA